MLAGMRHTVGLVLGLVLLALVVACGDTQPPAPAIEPTSTPDIEATVEAKVEEGLRVEATVEARLKEERAAEATVGARAQTMAKAMVEATAQAAPTSTPVPPTATPVPPTPTPSPTATPIPPTPTPSPTATPIPPTQSLQHYRYINLLGGKLE